MNIVLVLLLLTIVGSSHCQAFEQAFGASIRTGPVASQTSPNWRLCLGVGYENTEFEVFFGADINVSVHTNGVNDRGEDLILNTSGIALDFGYKLIDMGSDFTFTVGSGFGYDLNVDPDY